MERESNYPKERERVTILNERERVTIIWRERE